MEFDLSKLSEEQRELYDYYLNESKTLYPGIPEHCLSHPVLFYVLSGCDEECFEKLEERNKILSNDNIERNDNDETILSQE
jgi:hypothetical protein